MKRYVIAIGVSLLVLGFVCLTTESSLGAAKSAVKSSAAAASDNPIPLFDKNTKLDPDTIIDTPTALITRVGDRGRDRHAREWMFHAYEHYLALYWIGRTDSIEVVDTVAKGGKTVTFNMTSIEPLNGPNLRAFFQGKGTVAQYSDNMTSKQISPLHYQAVVNTNTNEHRPLKIGDRIEIEFSPFVKPPFEGRTNYYGTVFLYVVGTPGMQPWGWHTPVAEAEKLRGAAIDSYPLPALALSGGMTTSHQNYSDEPKNLFDQMATNMAPIDAQPFVLGRRLAHTDFGTGVHTEPGNPIFKEQVGRLGARYSAPGCSHCMGAAPPAVGAPMFKYLIKVGSDAKGTPNPDLGSVLQLYAAKGTTPEGGVSIAGWTTINGTYGDGMAYALQKPIYKFTGVVPKFYSIRLPLRAYGLGLLEAIDEGSIADIAKDSDGDMNMVTDPVTGQLRMGRFGWKAGQASLKDQIAKRLNDAMSITTTIYPYPDRGANQTDLDSAGHRLADADVENIYHYYGLRAVPPRRDFDDPQVQKGEKLFSSAGCVRCHIPTIKTSPYHPLAELRNQTIHPYTDLLVHDMGPGLADNMGEGTATGAEWRTPPLWGVGMVAPAMGTEASYLHDGRARNFAEAILWHGGTAEDQRENFRNMPAENRAALIRFLQSL